MQCKNAKSRVTIRKLVEFVVKSREPVSFVPINMFNSEHDNAIWLTCKVNSGQLFATFIEYGLSLSLFVHPNVVYILVCSVQSGKECKNDPFGHSDDVQAFAD